MKKKKKTAIAVRMDQKNKERCNKHNIWVHCKFAIADNVYTETKLGSLMNSNAFYNSYHSSLRRWFQELKMQLENDYTTMRSNFSSVVLISENSNRKQYLGNRISKQKLTELGSERNNCTERSTNSSHEAM